MNDTGKTPDKSGALYALLARADETYGRLPPALRLEIDRISRGLPEHGPRKLRRHGPGTEFFESRPWRLGDDPRRINARLSARAGKNMVAEKEAEIRQRFYLWRDSSPSMTYSSAPGALPSKKEAAEIMLLAFAKHLAKNEESVGILDGGGVFRGGRAAERLAGSLAEVTVVTGPLPATLLPGPGRRLPDNSVAVLFSDFMTDGEELLKGIAGLSGQNLQGFLVMVLDPQETDFAFSGAVEFEGMEGEGRLAFGKTQDLRTAYREKLAAHIGRLRETAAARGFKFILQRTDRPLHAGLLAIYGLAPQDAAPPGPGMAGPA